MHTMHTQYSIAYTYRPIHTQSCSEMHTEALEENQVFLTHMVLMRQCTFSLFCNVPFLLWTPTPAFCLLVHAASQRLQGHGLKHSGLGLPLALHASQGSKEAGMQ